MQTTLTIGIVLAVAICAGWAAYCEKERLDMQAQFWAELR